MRGGVGGLSHLLLLSDSLSTCPRCGVLLNNTVVFGSSVQTIPALDITGCTDNNKNKLKHVKS